MERLHHWEKRRCQVYWLFLPPRSSRKGSPHALTNVLAIANRDGTESLRLEILVSALMSEYPLREQLHQAKSPGSRSLANPLNQSAFGLRTGIW